MQDQPSGPAIIYAAKSTADPHGSIPTQFADGRKLAQRLGLEVVAEYSDEAATAWKGNRGPGLAAALKHAAEIGAVLIVQHSDRLARGDGVEARHLVQLVLEAKAAGITLRSVEDDGTFDNLVMAVVMGERNTEDSRRKSASVKAGMARRRQRGRHTGAKPYGYAHRWETDAEKPYSVLVPDSHTAAVVRRIFAEYLAGQSQAAITRALDADKVPTGRGGQWHQGTVRAILANPVYTALVRDGENLIKATHEPIIDHDTWEQAAALRQAKARTHGRGRASAGAHLFRKGFLRCGECGAAMVPRTGANRGGSMYETYLCYGRHRDPASCTQPPVPRAEVDAAVYAYFEEVGLDVEATRKTLAAAGDRKLAEARALYNAAQGEAQKAVAKLARVKGDYTSGELTAAEWRELRAELEPERDAAEAQAQRLAEQLTEAEAGTAVTDVEAELLEQLASIRAAVAGEVANAEGVDAVRAALLRLFDGFVLRREGMTPSATGGTRGPDGTDVYLDDDADGMRWIDPEPSWHAIKGFDEELRPVLAKKPLDKAVNNRAEGLVR